MRPTLRIRNMEDRVLLRIVEKQGLIEAPLMLVQSSWAG